MEMMQLCARMYCSCARYHGSVHVVNDCLGLKFHKVIQDCVHEIVQQYKHECTSDLLAQQGYEKVIIWISVLSACILSPTLLYSLNSYFCVCVRACIHTSMIACRHTNNNCCHTCWYTSFCYNILYISC